MASRWTGVGRALVVAMLGIPPLLNSLSNPRLAALHGADILRLVAVGFCFGVAFGLLVVTLKSPGRRGRQADA